MVLPFSTEQFYEVFGRYNDAVWPVQVLLLLLAVAAMGLVLWPRSWSDVVIAGVLGILWAWLGLAYHLAFFSRINPLAYVFAGASVVGALVFVWQGVVRRRLRFSWRKGAHPVAGLTLVAYALVVYPAWSWFAGHRYPYMPTFGLPCPTTLFTVGMLSFLVPGYPRSPFVVPILWCFVGAQAAYLLGVSQDFALFVAGGLGALLLARPQGARSA